MPATTLSTRHYEVLLPLAVNITITGVRASATFSGNVGLVKIAPAGSRAAATFSGNVGLVKIAPTGARATAIFSGNVGSVTTVTDAVPHRTLLGVGS